MWHDGWGWGWANWLMTGALILVFWAVVAAGIVVLVRYLGGSRSAGGQPPASQQQAGAEQILAERFARGEIDGEEYRRRRDLLRSGR